MDEKARTQALDPRQSYIVEAPAGSGKTELLTRRYLSLLSEAVQEPEEIIAVTFTRKAASEMKQRILKALEQAQKSSSEMEDLRTQLAQKVLQRDKAQGWDLRDNPSRLRIMTLDALCMMLAYKAPILSHFGGQPEIHAYPKMLYQKAVESLFLQTSEQDPWYASLKTLMHAFDRTEPGVSLLIDLLAKREQWLPYLYGRPENFRIYLSHVVEKLISKQVRVLKAKLEAVEPELLDHVAYASSTLLEEEPDHPLGYYQENRGLSKHPTEVLPWKSLKDWLLTQSGDWRKSFTKRQGFPSPSDGKNKEDKAFKKAKKESFAAFVEGLKDDTELLMAFQALEDLPGLSLDESEQTVLQSLMTLLPILVGFLNIAFKESGQVDFVEMSLGALHALKDEQGPTPIAQFLDYQLSHILVDEFQDTSYLQLQLLEQLISEWQPGEGKTLFLVGDPQQSIYRFRGAEVGVFLHAQQKGIGSVKLKSLSLKQNFRSAASLVGWINESFPVIFPEQDDLTAGAVTYKQAHSTVKDEGSEPIQVFAAASSYEESLGIIRCIQEIYLKKPDEKIAILVRTRSQLISLLPLLKTFEIPFFAKEIEQLAKKPHVIDLLALIKAMLFWEDRIAWLSVLRAPWLGLSLTDLLKLTESSQSMIWEALKDGESCVNLSKDAEERLTGFVQVIQYWYAHRDRKPFGDWMKSLWWALGGKALYPRPVEEEMNTVFKLIDQFTERNGYFDLSSFEDKLNSLYVDQTINTLQGSSEPFLSLMTIHQAKGLEFDTVILPQCHATAKKGDLSLLNWHEGWYGEEKLFLMGAKASRKGVKPQTLYHYIQSINHKKEAFELKRLLYVAVTRAKNKLIMTYTEDAPEEDKPFSPRSGSFLNLLWAHIQDLPALTPKIQTQGSKHREKDKPFLYRRDMPITLPEQFTLEDTNTDLNWPEKGEDWLRLSGILFHELMAEYTQRLGELNQADLFQMLHGKVQKMALGLGEREKVHHLVAQALERLFTDPKGQWIISGKHKNRLTEKGITLSHKGKIEHLILDCAFTDEKNQRWIVDYKLTHADPSETVDIKQWSLTYQPQLQRYKKALEALEGVKVRCALYFPIYPQWIEVG